MRRGELQNSRLQRRVNTEPLEWEVSQEENEEGELFGVPKYIQFK